MTKGIRHLDGSLMRADTWEELERAWSTAGMNAILPAGTFRESIASRALVWSGVELATDGSSEDFLQECERAGLLVTVSDATRSEPVREWNPTPRLVYIEERQRVADERLRAKEAATAGKGK
jgi:hypothetical protein